MSIASVANLVEALRQCRLLAPGEWEELARDLQSRFDQPRALAGELLRRGWLTPYQINQLFQDRGGDLLLGPYILLERLGEGGMGAVFKARHHSQNYLVALKVIRKDRCADNESILRFRREIRAATRLSHPNVVGAYDAEEVSGTLFFAMEYVEGIDLARLVKKQGPLPVAQACEYIRQAALGLQHAHEQGMVHRDLKPANLVLANGGAVKILDMGLARLAHTGEGDDHSATLTQDGSLMGTPDYMAPEQVVDSHTVDIRADLYSLGCTLYYLLSGRVPFPGKTLGEKLVKQQMHEAEPIQRLRPDVLAPVAAVVRRLMAKKPEDRYQTPAALAAALAGVLGMPVPAVAPAAESSDTVTCPGTTKPRADDATLAGDGPLAAGGGRRLRWLLVGGVVLLVCVVLGVVLLARGGAKVEPPPMPPAPPGPGSVKPPEKDGGGTLQGKVELVPPDNPYGADFAVQGEYEGTVGGKEKFGAQVIAQGNGQFTVRLLRGGLPGGGWDGRVAVQCDARAAAGAAAFAAAGWSGTILGGRLTGASPEGLLALQRVGRRSRALGTAAPPGAVVLFDGSGTAEWLKADGAPAGVLPAGAISRRTFKDFRAHLEFFLPFQPERRGQGRANSGVFLQNRYEIQILDSFGLRGLKNECGALYDQAAPAVNMCLPPCTWQTYDLEFHAARFAANGRKVRDAWVTVQQNGVMVLDRVDIQRASAQGQREEDTPGPLLLQAHGSPVVFRNVWVQELQ